MAHILHIHYLLDSAFCIRGTALNYITIIMEKDSLFYGNCKSHKSHFMTTLT